jgi:hypothetical protein
MYYIEKYFPKSYLLKVFIIGTSAISYLLTFYNVGLVDKENRIIFDYKTFTVVEPIIQGLLFVFCAIVLKDALNITLFNSLMLGAILGPIIWLFSVIKLKTYKYNTNTELFNAFMRVLVAGLLKYYVLYYLLLKLK